MCLYLASNNVVKITITSTGRKIAENPDIVNNTLADIQDGVRGLVVEEDRKMKVHGRQHVTSTFMPHRDAKALYQKMKLRDNDSDDETENELY